jgi:hypothetical protein
MSPSNSLSIAISKSLSVCALYSSTVALICGKLRRHMIRRKVSSSVPRRCIPAWSYYYSIFEINLPLPISLHHQPPISCQHRVLHRDWRLSMKSDFSFYYFIFNISTIIRLKSPLVSSAISDSKL